ncbi:MAG: hypothetical protein V1694_00935 [Candidatus Eisenbacteria bacterium]
MPSAKSTCEILYEARNIHRARKICAALREDRVLARAPGVVLLLADKLLKSLAQR